MRKLKILFLLLLTCSQSFAAISGNTVWEVRNNGNDTNGGGFVTGASGTDMSQFDNKNAAACSNCQSSTVNISVTNGVTAGTTTITSATANFSASIVGNIISVSGGTGAITQGWYQVTTFTNATTVIVDRSTGLSAGTGVTVNIGGALLTLGQLATNFVAGNNAYVKAQSTYSISTGVTFATAMQNTFYSRIIGYTTTRTDGGQFTLQATAGITMLTFSALGYSLEDAIIDANSTGTIGISATAATFQLYNSVVKGTSGGACISTSTSNGTFIYKSEVTNCGATAGISSTSANTTIDSSYVHGMAISGLISSQAVYATNNVFASITGTSDGIALTGSSPGMVSHNSFYTIGRDCYRPASANMMTRVIVSNNIFDTCAGVAVDFTASGSATYIAQNIYNNAYFNNGTNRVGFAAESGAVTLTAEPFTSPGTGNFTENSTAGGGAATKKAGFPGAILNATGSTGFADIGALQRNDPAGSAAASGGSIQ